MARPATLPLNDDSRDKLVQVLQSSPPEDEEVPSTLFPWLDTLNHVSTSQPCGDETANGLERASQDIPLTQDAHSLLSPPHILALLRAFGSFVLDFTGEPIVLFRCTIVVPEIYTPLWEGAVQARAEHKSQSQVLRHNVEIRVYNRNSPKYAQAASVTEFALEIWKHTKAGQPNGCFFKVNYR